MFSILFLCCCIINCTTKISFNEFDENTILIRQLNNVCLVNKYHSAQLVTCQPCKGLAILKCTLYFSDIFIAFFCRYSRNYVSIFKNGGIIFYCDLRSVSFSACSK